MFTFNDVYSDGGYSDFYMIDSSAKTLRRVWTVTYDHESKTWYGILRRSETNTSEFLDAINLPKKMVEAIKSFIPLDKLP